MVNNNLDDLEYIIYAKKIKCFVHFDYKDVLNSNKKIEEKDAFFKPCNGHYHTMQRNKSIIICSNSKCIKKQKKYLESIENEDFFFYCNSPYCQ